MKNGGHDEIEKLTLLDSVMVAQASDFCCCFLQYFEHFQ